MEPKTTRAKTKRTLEMAETKATIADLPKSRIPRSYPNTRKAFRRHDRQRREAEEPGERIVFQKGGHGSSQQDQKNGHEQRKPELEPHPLPLDRTRPCRILGRVLAHRLTHAVPSMR